jgi:hypothetical protein
VASSQRKSAARAVDMAQKLVTERTGREPRSCPSCTTSFLESESTAGCRSFCSERCERAFAEKAIRSLTVEDCIRIQQRFNAYFGSLKTADPELS